MGPRKAAQMFLAEAPDSTVSCRVTLYGSLAATGKGHLTDKAILDIIEPVYPCDIDWHPEIVLPFHTNGMMFQARDADGKVVKESTFYSIGGGDVVREGESRQPGKPIY